MGSPITDFASQVSTKLRPIGELLFELLLGVAELLFEVFFELAAAALLDLLLRAIGSLFNKFETSSPVRASSIYALLGALSGVLSVLIFPHPLFHPSRIHGISLLISPVIAGLLMALLGSTLRKRGKKVVRLESFGYGFAFAFGMALIRLIYAR